jgi:hypothetical protein
MGNGIIGCDSCQGVKIASRKGAKTQRKMGFWWMSMSWMPEPKKTGVSKF